MKDQIASPIQEKETAEPEMGGAISKQTGGASLPPPPFQLNAQPVQLQAAPGGVIQRSPLSDELEQLWAQGKGPFFDRLRALDATQRADADLVTYVNTLTGDDQWLALRILEHGPEPMWPAGDLATGRQHAEDGNWASQNDSVTASVGTTESGAPINAWYFPGQTDRRALVIAGVHGSERQGIEVAERIRNDIEASTTAPYFTVIVVPCLFPDSAARGSFGRRETRVDGQSTLSNRNFPSGGQTLEQSRNASGTPEDAEGNTIALENQALMALMERFSPERIISIHGTQNPELAGVSVDPLASQEAEDRALALRTAQETVSNFDTALTGAGENLQNVHDGIAGRFSRGEIQGEIQDRMNTGELSGRSSNRMSPSERDLVDDTSIVAGNHLFLGAGNASTGWGGSNRGGISLGGYGPARGMSIYTVEPGVNRNSADFAAGNDRGDQLNGVQRQMELQAYADAVRTVMLGPDPAPAQPATAPTSPATVPANP